MDIEFTEEFKEKSKEIEKIRETIETSLNKCKNFQKTDNSLTVEVDWTEKQFYLKNKNGVHGRTITAEKIEIMLNTNVKGWKEMLKTIIAHEYVHTYFFQITGLKYESNIENWRHFLLEAHGQHFTQKIYPNKEVSWRTKNTREEVSKKWNEIKPQLDDKIYENKIIGNKKYPLYFGYSTAYYIGQKLLEKHSLKEIPRLEQKNVIKAGDQIFNHEN